MTQRNPWNMLFAGKARVLRFVLTGGLAGLVQLVLLKLLTDFGWHALLANTVSFLLAAQLNFALSSIFTWRDRRTGLPIRRQWLTYHGSIAGMAILNMAVFVAARTIAPDLAASAMGICVAATGNFLIGDRLVFRPHGRIASSDASQPAREAAA